MTAFVCVAIAARWRPWVLLAFGAAPLAAAAAHLVRRGAIGRDLIVVPGSDRSGAADVRRVCDARPRAQSLRKAFTTASTSAGRSRWTACPASSTTASVAFGMDGGQPLGERDELGVQRAGDHEHRHAAAHRAGPTPAAARRCRPCAGSTRAPTPCCAGGRRGPVRRAWRTAAAPPRTAGSGRLRRVRSPPPTSRRRPGGWLVRSRRRCRPSCSRRTSRVTRSGRSSASRRHSRPPMEYPT